MQDPVLSSFSSSLSLYIIMCFMLTRVSDAQPAQQSRVVIQGASRFYVLKSKHSRAQVGRPRSQTQAVLQIRMSHLPGYCIFGFAPTGFSDTSFGFKRAELVQMLSMSGVDRANTCDLNALTPEERNHRQILLRSLAQTIIGRSELANGFEFSFDAARLDLGALGEWIALERRCCPFLHFRLDLEPGGKTALALTGGEGVKEFLRAGR